jgi:hypothetical protein
MEHARGSVNAEGDVLVVVSGGVALSVLPHVARPVAHHLAPGVASREEFKSSRVQGRVQGSSVEGSSKFGGCVLRGGLGFKYQCNRRRVTLKTTPLGGILVVMYA